MGEVCRYRFSVEVRSEGCRYVEASGFYVEDGILLFEALPGVPGDFVCAFAHGTWISVTREGEIVDGGDVAGGF